MLDRRRFATQVEARLAVFDFLEGCTTRTVATPPWTTSHPYGMSSSTVRRPRDRKPEPVHETGATPCAR